MRIGRLDGLRALAVLMVILLHHHLLDFGGAGVDLFFVLSGYLITGILRKARFRKTYWSAFYLKRVTRIMPPVLLLIATAFLITHNAKLVSLFRYMFFLGGFDVVGENTIPSLGNLWSLAVEEHFYLVWPFAIRYMKRRSLVVLLLALLIGEPLLRVLMIGHLKNNASVYYLTPFRLDGLAAGSMLSLALEDKRIEFWLARWSGLVTVVLVAAGLIVVWSSPNILREDANTLARNGFYYSFVTCIMTCIIGYVLLRPQAWLSRLLSCAPVVWFGTISYGVYLYGGLIQATALKLAHTPSYPAPDWLQHRLLFPDLLLITGVAWLSFRFYEHPIVLWGKQKADNNTASESVIGDMDLRY